MSFCLVFHMCRIFWSVGVWDSLQCWWECDQYSTVLHTLYSPTKKSIPQLAASNKSITSSHEDTKNMSEKVHDSMCGWNPSINVFSNRFFCKWQQKLEVRCTASNTLADSSQVLVERKWFDKWRACLHLRVLTKTADQHYNSLLVKKTYHFVTSWCCYTVCVFMCLRWFCCFSGVQKTSSCKEILCYPPTIITYGLFCTLESCDVD